MNRSSRVWCKTRALRAGLAAGAATLTVLTGSAVPPAGAEPAAASPATTSSGDRSLPDDVRRVVFVGNNWAGTADLLAPHSFRRIGRINVIPDYEQRMQEIATNPYRLAYFLAIREAVGEGQDQFVDDMYS